MNTKKVTTWAIVAIVAIIAIFLALPSKVPTDISQATITQVSANNNFEELSFTNAQEVPINMESSFFEFEGFALDGKKSHPGSFGSMTGSLFVENGVVTGMTGVIEANSVDTGIDGLNKHLLSDDFFDVANHPTIEFTTTRISDKAMSGDLTFHGVTHEVTFPITRTDNSISAEFLLDTTPFNIKYTGINKEVAVKFVFTA